jgi:hypothetical protein
MPSDFATLRATRTLSLSTIKGRAPQQASLWEGCSMALKVEGPILALNVSNPATAHLLIHSRYSAYRDHHLEWLPLQGWGLVDAKSKDLGFFLLKWQAWRSHLLTLCTVRPRVFHYLYLKCFRHWIVMDYFKWT